MGNTDDYEERLHDLKSQFKSALDSFLVIYPRYKINPGFPSYSKAYAEAKGKLDEIKSKLNDLRYDAQHSTSDLADHIETVDRRIAELTQENEKLRARNDILVGAKNASVGQMESYRDDYRNNVFSLLTLLLSSTIVVKIML